jgi:hypothetical protein
LIRKTPPPKKTRNLDGYNLPLREALWSNYAKIEPTLVCYRDILDRCFNHPMIERVPRAVSMLQPKCPKCGGHIQRTV